MTPILSVVTGTYQRLEALIDMVKSVRDSIPSGLSYEIIVVDGNSNDGTPLWCEAQRDIRLIQHGALKGAINAFCDGAKAAQGKYVLLANDDVKFTAKEAILRAIVYLEENAKCGAVAFMDDRLYQPEDKVRYKAQLQRALDSQGKPTQVIYAQVGLFRKWLGDACGWWGADDPIMSQARTYGGDNFLSSKIWEAGYTVDIIQGVQCDDYRIEDGLRTFNEAARDHAYWERFPDGPHINSSPIDHDDPEQMRILYLPIFEPHNPIHRKNKRGLFNALSKRAIVVEWDYLNDTRFNLDFINAFKPHLILTQFHDGKRGPLLAELKQRAPDAYFINWNGDARGLKDPAYIDMLKGIDLQLVVNAAVEGYEQAGIRTAYWQIGVEDAIPTEDVPSHDVVFLGNAYSEQRTALGAVLRSLNCNVGLYGYGWKDPDGACLYDFNVGAGLYSKAKIAIADTFSDGKTDVIAFVSNRTFQAMAAGAFVLQQRSPRLEEFTGLKAGVHYAEWRTLDELPDLIAHYLKNTAERKKIAKAGQKFVLENYNFDTQVVKLFRDLMGESERVLSA